MKLSRGTIVLVALALTACSAGRRSGTSTETGAARPPSVLDSLAVDELFHGPSAPPRVLGLHRRWRMNAIAAAAGGGFVLAGGGRGRAPGPDGAVRDMFAMDLVRVDPRFEVRWRWPAPDGLFPHGVAGAPDGGAVASFGTNAEARLGQDLLPSGTWGVLAVDASGGLRWAVPFPPRSQPRHVAVEPGPSGRIAVLTPGVITRDEQQQPPVEEWGILLELLGPDGTAESELRRPWSSAIGLAWVAPGRVLIMGGRRGRPDPALRLLPDDQGGQGGAPTEGGAGTGVAELVDVETGEVLWTREWGKVTLEWETPPAVAPGGAIAFVELFVEDSSRRDAHGRSPERLVVLDGADGRVRWSRLMDSSCGWLHPVVADPRNGDWLLVSPSRCGGYDNHPGAVVVERLAPEGAVRWAETLGETLPPGPGGEPPQPLIHPTAAAVDGSGTLAFVGHAGRISLLGHRIATDFEHVALVFAP